jgi:thioredoxin-related protein
MSPCTGGCLADNHIPHSIYSFMKTLVLIAAIALLTPGDWLSDFDQAKEIANEQGKLILLNFSGSDWCAPCIRMKREVFESQDFQSFAREELVLLKADFPRQKKNQLDAHQKQHNEKLAERYNPHGKFPLTLLLSPKGEVLREWDGYNGASAAEFVKQINQTSNGK